MVRAARGTRPLADVQPLLAAVLAAARTDLARGEPRVGLDQRPAVKFTFIFELADERAPPGVPDRFRQAAVLHHLPRLQRLDHDDLVLVDDASRQLVEEVVPAVPYLFMLFGQQEPRLLAIPAAGLLAGERALSPFEPRLGLSQVARVRNLLRDEIVVRHGGEVHESEVNPDLMLGRDPRLVGLLDEERYEEPARPRHRHGRRADLPVEAAMLCEPDEPDLRQTDFSRLDADRAVLVVRRVGRARLPSRLEHREAGRPGEELRESRVEVHLRVREREAVRLAQEREQRLVGGRCRRLPPRPAARLRLLVDGDAVLEQLVVDEAGAADRLDQGLGLCRGRVEPVFVSLQHVRPSFARCRDDPRPIPIPAEGTGKSDGITNFCSSFRHSGGRGRRGRRFISHLRWAMPYAPRRLEEGEFSPNLVKLEMKAYQVAFERNAQKTLKKMDSQQAWIIMAWIKKNLVGTDDPRRHGKGLVANHSSEWRYRIGDYRLIADIQDETITILILEIGHRRDIYK